MNEADLLTSFDRCVSARVTAGAQYEVLLLLNGTEHGGLIKVALRVFCRRYRCGAGDAWGGTIGQVKGREDT